MDLHELICLSNNLSFMSNTIAWESRNNGTRDMEDNIRMARSDALAIVDVLDRLIVNQRRRPVVQRPPVIQNQNPTIAQLNRAMNVYEEEEEIIQVKVKMKVLKKSDFDRVMNDPCCICMESYTFGTSITTCCGHSFCTECYSTAITRSDKCPLCRKESPKATAYRQRKYSRPKKT